MSWSVSEAKAKLSALLAKARRAPQVIENRGEEVAVVLSIEEYERLQQQAALPRPTPLAEFLDFTSKLKNEGDLSFELPRRRHDRHRPGPFDDEG